MDSLEERSPSFGVYCVPSGHRKPRSELERTSFTSSQRLQDVAIDHLCISCATTLQVAISRNMPPPDDGNQYLPFEDLIKLEKIDEVTYRSITLPYSPGGQLPNAVPRAYGGHVYAQSAWAACQTVNKGLLIYVCKCAARSY